MQGSRLGKQCPKSAGLTMLWIGARCCPHPPKVTAYAPLLCVQRTRCALAAPSPGGRGVPSYGTPWGNTNTASTQAGRHTENEWCRGAGDTRIPEYCVRTVLPKARTSGTVGVESLACTSTTRDDPRLGAARRVTIHGGFVVELLRALVQWGGLCPRLRRFALAASDKQKELELVNAC